MERVSVATGSSLGGRYLVQKPAWISSLGEAYVGRDTVLDRPVLVFPLPFDDQERVGALAQIHHPGLLQIYDAGPGWMVCEYPSGGRLEEKLAKGALDLGHASRAVRDVVRALTALHASGVAHGAIGSDLVVFDEEGRAKLAGFSFTAPATTADDDAALGRLAWHTFTGTEPGAGRTPKLPPTVADLLRRMISSDPVLRPRLREIDDTLAPYARTTAPEPKASFLRQEGRWLFPVLALIGLGVAAVIVGLRIDLGPIQIGTPPKPAASATPLAVASVTDFDPLGDGNEEPGKVRNVIDKQDATPWSTVWYTRANFGNEKAGVGLLFDLGQRQQVSRILMKAPFAGWRAEWRVADARSDRPDGYRLVGQNFTSTTDTTTTFTPAVGGRYWLLWITLLTENPNPNNDRLRYQAGVSEVRFFA